MSGATVRLADAFIVATGGWTGKLLELAPLLQLKRAIVFYLEPPADLASAWAEAPSFLDFGGPDDLCLFPPLDGEPIKLGAGTTSTIQIPCGACATTSRSGCTPAWGSTSATSTATASSTTRSWWFG
ncbi:MAG: hypothetical protein WAS21_06725, partial [Geminicoccaceae bacterium]